jgi:NADPH-dependent 2,4-dienoyl-CoA reductase/sulfur reductase-like enzyme
MKVRKLVIVGGVAGGASAAAKARRCSEEVEIIMYEKGPDISYANCGLPPEPVARSFRLTAIARK